ncbi:hypothetical protein ColTof4_09762 [Colletotrichum tofieldiae]|nr:hypothetical protein ColTof3_05117 [Colletotrichum tofieldiae]GKT77339.1 hypothetical protein ColTof4_09762 [Colletotrichum tofieldiae]GKT86268.1 hypothetical protein Ct61P_04118 [Colletotrichum tofieldiae]
MRLGGCPAVWRESLPGSIHAAAPPRRAPTGETLRDRDPRNEQAGTESYTLDGGEDDLSNGLRRVSGLPTTTSIALLGKRIVPPRALPRDGSGAKLGSLVAEVSPVTPEGQWLFGDADPGFREDEQDAGQTAPGPS